ncbi:hypothetical protein [Pseudobacteriovorax antillogorgiicola]|uniref:Transposase n=1 Tax=Pseudobacteriovorax antillogorgiicola TaxID=1513793 RepID=A0A1Y6CRA3_9BACT|nr:hypothetical protein [Pseudobacteriovorax antillogorgiicola]TCS41571.1 hypothetical protein EDD56_14710 [Pseudobacteriovorax antillogorgiicola]SMF83331.1 hypothetical protein SAMN06296036_1467 [Pseudobacteriovorax antillogorgiicola]
MKIELESLAPKFEASRSRAKGKRVIYPTKLRKAAAQLIEDHSHKTLANELGVSVASIKSWAKTFAPKVSEKDLIQIESDDNTVPLQVAGDDINVKIIAMEISVPSGKLAATLTDIMRGMGASSC